MSFWTTPEGLRYSRSLFNRMLYTCYAIYLWEWFVSLDFEYKCIYGPIKKKWPLIIYFTNRYLMLACVITSIALNNVPKDSPHQCKPLLICVQVLGHSSLGLASVNMAIRTVAIWNFNPYVTTLLSLLAAGQWIWIIIGVVHLEVVWAPQTGCTPHETGWTLKTLYAWAIAFDLVVLALSIIKLHSTLVELQVSNSFGLTRMVFKHGVLYFLIATLGNMTAVILLFINLNSMMSALFDLPAELISTLVACRAVRYLMLYNYDDGTIKSATRAWSQPVFFGRAKVAPEEDSTYFKSTGHL